MCKKYFVLLNDCSDCFVTFPVHKLVRTPHPPTCAPCHMLKNKELFGSQWSYCACAPESCVFFPYWLLHMQTWVFVPDLRATSCASLQASYLRSQRLSASPGPFNPHRSTQMFPLKIMDLDHTQAHMFWDFKEAGEHVKKDWKNNYIYVKLPKSLCVCVYVCRAGVVVALVLRQEL